MHATDSHSEIERRAVVTGKGFVQHGAKLVLGDAADPIEGYRASSLANDLCGRDSRSGRRRIKWPWCVRYAKTAGGSRRPFPGLGFCRRFRHTRDDLPIHVIL